MKRISNLYPNIYNFDNIVSAYNEVCRNTKNKRKIAILKQYKAIYISRTYDILYNKKYSPSPVNIFTIYEPKERRIVSQCVQDKIINHLVARHIIFPAMFPSLVEVNVACRKKYGTSKGLNIFYEYHKICKIKYGEYYILKCDVSKFFASINHDVLKNKILRKIKDKDAIDILFKIIDNEKVGLDIGSMTSQAFAIYYLNDMDHYIKEQLKIKYYIRYQDDFLLFHPSKIYLQECLKRIKEFLKVEKLTLNNKTRIYKNSNNFVFLGRTSFRKYSKYRNIKRKIKKKFYLYNCGKSNLLSLASTIICYDNIKKRYNN